MDAGRVVPFYLLYEEFRQEQCKRCFVAWETEGEERGGAQKIKAIKVTSLEISRVFLSFNDHFAVQAIIIEMWNIFEHRNEVESCHLDGRMGEIEKWGSTFTFFILKRYLSNIRGYKVWSASSKGGWRIGAPVSSIPQRSSDPCNPRATTLKPASFTFRPTLRGSLLLFYPLRLFDKLKDPALRNGSSSLRNGALHKIKITKKKREKYRTYTQIKRIKQDSPISNMLFSLSTSRRLNDKITTIKIYQKFI